MTKAMSISYRADSFFALRTPLLPFTDYLRWAENLRAPAAVDDGTEALATALKQDKERLRSAMRELVRRAEIREAIYLASPTLDEGIEHWLRNPESERGRGVELVLVRYFQRMTHRCTPFGLFAGHSFGRFGIDTKLALRPLQFDRRNTRFDHSYLDRIAGYFAKSATLRNTFSYRPNDSMYQATGRLRYTEFVIGENGYRTYKLVAVTETPHLLATLECARFGAKIELLAGRLVEVEGVSLEEAEAFIHELIDSQILTPDFGPRITGPDSIEELTGQLQALPETSAAGSLLHDAAVRLREIDQAGIGQPPERYRQLGRDLDALPVPVDLSKLVQVDLFRPATDFHVGRNVVEEIEHCTSLLRRITPRTERSSLDAFRDAFRARHEGRWVPLMEVLDPETGIGFPVGGGSPAEDAPLLDNFIWGSAGNEENSGWSSREILLFKRVQRIISEGSREWRLDEEDVNALDESAMSAVLPDSAAVTTTLIASSEEAVRRGDFQLLLRGGCYGPPGVRLLGRFCHGDAELHEHAREHARTEERYQPNVVFAELVHLPQGRSGNVLMRPVLRDHEVVFLGRSGIDTDRQIRVSDLMVSVVDDRVVLYSMRLGKEVVPTLSSAMSFSGIIGFGLFVGALLGQHTQNWMGWDWGKLRYERFLPRVTYGRMVLARAQWTADAKELRPLFECEGVERFRRIQAWRKERGLPRFSLLVDADNELLVDLDNALSIETFCDLARKRRSIVLAENLPDEEELAVQGPEGRYTNELVIPLLRVRDPAELPRAALRYRREDAGGVAETLAPGSEWLFFKLYGGKGTADLVLVETIAPVIAELKARGVIRGWFFIRYGDPDPHLRVRLHGDPERLCADALSEMYRRLNPLIQNGSLWRVELGTYQREIDRYGGEQNIARAERLFELDSEAALAIIQQCPGDTGASLRWQLALAGADRWLRDFGLDLAARHELARKARDGYLRETRAEGKAIQGWFSDRFRKERKAVAQLINARRSHDDGPACVGLDVLARRSQRSAVLIAEIHALSGQGRLSTSINDLARSLIHMYVNRVLRSAQRTQELVIYEFLVRLYASEIARRDALLEETTG
jgi:thiopeptide-type bacteriocin biosynthesis protein